MTARKSAPYAVLMGDIVGSERAPAKAVHHAFNQAVAAANKKHAAAIASPLTITLGDEFQGLLRLLGDAWAVAAELRLRLAGEGVPCRFVIGVVALQTPLNTDRAWNMMGPGLAAARDKLNEKRAANAYRFSFPDDPILERLLDAVGDSLTQVELGWTDTQRAYLLKSRASKRTNARLAAALGVSERSLYKVLRAARADFYERQFGAVRQTLIALDQRHGLT